MRHLMMLLVLGVVACEEPSGPNNRLVGTYNLETVNGDTLPASISRVTEGRYSFDGSTISLPDPDGAATGMLSDDGALAVTLSGETHVLRFVR